MRMPNLRSLDLGLLMHEDLQEHRTPASGVHRGVDVGDWLLSLGHFPPDFAELCASFAEQGIYFASVPDDSEEPDTIRDLDNV